MLFVLVARGQRHRSDSGRGAAPAPAAAATSEFNFLHASWQLSLSFMRPVLYSVASSSDSLPFYMLS